MTKVALMGDSITLTYYLTAASNSALITYHGKDITYAHRLDNTIPELLTRTDVVIGNFGKGSWTVKRALEDETSFTSGVWGSPITITATVWDAIKSWEPDILLMSFGTNDANSYTLNDFDGYLRQVFDDCLQLGIHVAYWNGSSVQWGSDYDDAVATARRNLIYPYYDYASNLAVEYGFDAIDTRSVWRAEQLAGNWDLFLHRDGTYLSSIAGYPNPPELYYDIHPWIAGQDITSRVLANYLDYGVGDLDIILDNLVDLDIILDEITGLPIYVNGKQVLEMYAGGKRVLKMYVDGKTVFE